MKKLLYILIASLILSSPSFAKVYWYNATSLTGGGTSALDAINGQNIINNDKCLVVTASGQTYWYNLDSDSALSESSPYVISPDSNAGDKRWILQWKGERSALPDSTIDQGDNSVVGSIAWHISNISGNGGTIKLFEGTYSVDTVINLDDDIKLIGSGRNKTIIQKEGSNTDSSILSASGKSGIVIRDLTVDGNKANNTAGSNNIVLSTSYNVLVENIESKNAQANSGYGAGLVISDGKDGTNDTVTRILTSTFRDNDGDGITIQKGLSVYIENNLLDSNGANGIDVIDLVYPPVQSVTQHLKIAGNRAINNTTTGIIVYGFYEDGTSASDIEYGPYIPQSEYATIEGNQCVGNGTYGIAAQGRGFVISNNNTYSNGTPGSSAGGILANGWAITIDGNVSTLNDLYGIDAGGCFNCVISNNTVSYNTSAGVGGIGINVGASVYTVVTGNNLEDNGETTLGYGITAPGIDGDGVNEFNWLGSHVKISDNFIKVAATSGVGIEVTRDFNGGLIDNNYIVGAPANKHIVVSAEGFRISNNINDDMTDNAYETIASASAIVVGDAGNFFYITGTTDINNIYPYSTNTYYQKVRDVRMTNMGSGYTVAPTVGFSGGAGSNAAATAEITLDGKVVGVTMTNNGTGYTSAPTVAFTGGDGSGAAGTAKVGCNNFGNRKITLVFAGILDMKDATGNLQLNGDYTTAAGSVLTLVGLGAMWYEVSRQ